MSIERYLKRAAKKDTAVYWSNPAVAADASFTFDTPVEIDCIWTEKITQIRDNSGKEIVSKAGIWVTQDLDDNGMLFHGVLTDLSTAEKSDPRKRKDAYEIKLFIKTPSLHISGTYVRKAMI